MSSTTKEVIEVKVGQVWGDLRYGPASTHLVTWVGERQLSARRCFEDGTPYAPAVYFPLKLIREKFKLIKDVS